MTTNRYMKSGTGATCRGAAPNPRADWLRDTNGAAPFILPSVFPSRSAVNAVFFHDGTNRKKYKNSVRKDAQKKPKTKINFEYFSKHEIIKVFIRPQCDAINRQVAMAPKTASGMVSWGGHSMPLLCS
jgi:hypothetical protein